MVLVCSECNEPLVECKHGEGMRSLSQEDKDSISKAASMSAGRIMKAFHECSGDGCTTCKRIEKIEDEYGYLGDGTMI